VKLLLLALLITIALCKTSLVTTYGQNELGNASPLDGDDSETFSLHISATIDGSELLVFTPGSVHWEHKYWSPATNIVFNGHPWTNLFHSPTGWQEIAQDLDLTKAHIVQRKGRDVIALETTKKGFNLYLCDSPDGAADYDVTIAIPRGQ